MLDDSYLSTNSVFEFLPPPQKKIAMCNVDTLLKLEAKHPYPVDPGIFYVNKP